MHETWDPDHDQRDPRADVAQVALDSLGRQKRELDAERELQEALLRFSWICAACGWALFLLKAAGCF